MTNAVLLLHPCSLPASRSMWKNILLCYHCLSTYLCIVKMQQESPQPVTRNNVLCCDCTRSACPGGRWAGAASDHLDEEGRQENFLFPLGTLSFMPHWSAQMQMPHLSHYHLPDQIWCLELVTSVAIIQVFTWCRSSYLQVHKSQLECPQG